MIAGVCAGLANYLDVDVAIIRVAAVILAFSGGAALLAYIIGWIAIPEARPGELPPRSARPTDRSSSNAARWIAGAVLIAIGGVWLIGNAFPFSLRFHALWPIVLIGVGVFIVVQGSRR